MRMQKLCLALRGKNTPLLLTLHALPLVGAAFSDSMYERDRATYVVLKGKVADCIVNRGLVCF